MAFRAMVDMRRTDEEKLEDTSPIAPEAIPDYPGGLTISLTERELEKLDLDDDDVEVGDMLHFQTMGTVRAVSKNAFGGEAHCRIELQLTHICCLENEATEDAASE